VENCKVRGLAHFLARTDEIHPDPCPKTWTGPLRVGLCESLGELSAFGVRWLAIALQYGSLKRTNSKRVLKSEGKPSHSKNHFHVEYRIKSSLARVSRLFGEGLPTPPKRRTEGLLSLGILRSATMLGRGPATTNRMPIPGFGAGLLTSPNRP